MSSSFLIALVSGGIGLMIGFVVCIIMVIIMADREENGTRRKDERMRRRGKWPMDPE